MTKTTRRRRRKRRCATTTTTGRNHDVVVGGDRYLDGVGIGPEDGRGDERDEVDGWHMND